MNRDRLRARADRVNAEADLGELLQEWGYDVVPDRQREQQFSCDLHGPDNKPSARYYGSSNSTYCWVCQKTRDAIAWVMEKEYLGFREAIEELETRLGLENLPWSDEHERAITPEDEIGDATRKRSRSYDEERDTVRTVLDRLTSERDLDAQKVLAFWEAFDRIEYGIAKENWDQAKGISAMDALRGRVHEALVEAES